MADATDYLLNDGVLRVTPDWQHATQTVFMTADHTTLVIQPRDDAEAFDTTLALAADDLPDIIMLDRRQIAFGKGLGEMAELTFTVNGVLQHQIVVRYTMGQRSLTFYGTTAAPMTIESRRKIQATIASFRPYAGGKLASRNQDDAGQP